MKRALLIILIVASMLASGSPARAWQINVTNSCNKSVTILGWGNTDVVGTGNQIVDTLETIDCRVTVNAGATGTCYMPSAPAICITNITGEYTSGGSTYDLNKVHCTHVSTSKSCCKNINVEVINSPSDGCKLRLR